MAIPVVLGADDQSVYIRILDSTTFLAKTNVTSASAGLALVYRKGMTGAVTAITESDLAGVDSAHSDGGMIHINAGLYRVDVVDAAVPTIENEVTIVSGEVTGGIILPSALVGVQPIGAPAGVSIAADLAAIEGQTDDIGVAGAGLTALVADVTKINGSAAAAARLALSAAQIIPGTVNDANTAPSTTVFAAADITEATADHYKGRLVLWTTGNLAGQVTDVTAYELDTGEGKFTCTALTETPADGDTFVLV